MILLIHIIAAIISLAFATYVLFRPSKRKLYAGYALTAATLASGSYLAISMHSSLTHACMSGLLYLGIVSTELLTARHKLATIQL